MVSLEVIRASNQRIAKDLPPRLVAVFVGGTSGVGETSLKQFVKHARSPRVYFVGRSNEAAKGIKKELAVLNSEGDYKFIKSDVSLMRNVDKVCADIAAKEEAINLLFLSTGTMIVGTKTDEDLHLITAITFYSRIRFISNLLPLLSKATALRRVVNVFAGSKEGPISTDDFQGWNLKVSTGRGHLASMFTLSLESLAREAPNVSFIHDFPGFVKSGLSRGTQGVAMAMVRTVFKLIGPLYHMPYEEAGDRQAFFATSARFPSRNVEGGRDIDETGVTVSGVHTCVGSDGIVGSGVYTIDSDGEPGNQDVVQVLAGLRNDGTSEKLRKHIRGEFERISGAQPH